MATRERCPFPGLSQGQKELGTVVRVVLATTRWPPTKGHTRSPPEMVRFNPFGTQS